MMTGKDLLELWAKLMEWILFSNSNLVAISKKINFLLRKNDMPWTCGLFVTPVKNSLIYLWDSQTFNKMHIYLLPQIHKKIPSIIFCLGNIFGGTPFIQIPLIWLLFINRLSLFRKIIAILIGNYQKLVLILSMRLGC